MRSDAGDVIASRIFERDDGAVELCLYKPQPDPDPELDADPDNPPWRCFYTLGFPNGKTARHSAVGIDSVQALLLAFASAKGRLCHVGDGSAERHPPLRWLGQDDLGLSIVHFE